MAQLYVTSPGPGEGKTAVAAGLLQVLGNRGVQSYGRLGDAAHPDAGFVRSALGLLQSDAPSIVEGDGAAPAGSQTLVVAAFGGEKTIERVRSLAAGSLGVIVNAVPSAQGRYIERSLRPALEAAGVRLLGVLPEERALRAARVGDLAAFLGGEVVAGHDFLDNEFQSVMIGAMSHQGSSAISYFMRMDRKIVVTGGDRIDVHLGALGTPTEAIILTGGYGPDPVVVERAEAENTPIISVLAETPDTMERIGEFLRAARFGQQSKVAAMADLLRQHVDLEPIERALGLQAAAV